MCGRTSTTTTAAVSLSAVLLISIPGPSSQAREEPGGDTAAGETLELKARYRHVTGPGETPEIHEKVLRWNPKKTGIVICDMWDRHWCKGATRRVAEMAPVMNSVVAEARRKGVLIVHAPSGTLGAYKDAPQRRRAQNAPDADNLPDNIDKWCSLIRSREGGLPIDDSDGGCDCEPKCPSGSPWSRQIESIRIDREDAISDSGREVWNLFEKHGIENLILMGVHTNMCVIGRSFGVRNMVRFGKNVVLMRDMTDTMYNSRMKPFVSHFRGTDLVIQHIEEHWCPTITSSDLTGSEAFRFKNDVRPVVAVAIAEKLYKTAETLPAFAREIIEDRLGLRASVLQASPDDPNSIPGLEALENADLLVLSVRRRALRETELAAVRAHLEAGKPLIALRTSSHAFDARGRKPPGHSEWRSFDSEVLGGNYHGHYAAGPEATIDASTGAGDHPVLAGVGRPFRSSGSLYKTSPLATTAKPLLIGAIAGQPAEPVAWTNSYKGARVFYTSLGHEGDFKNAAFVCLLTNAVRWALKLP